MFEGVSCEFVLIRLLTNEARGGTSLERSLHVHTLIALALFFTLIAVLSNLFPGHC